MPVPRFPADYADARARFVEAARAAGGVLRRYDNPAPGPQGLALSTDVSWYGPRDAERVLMTISATHGVEGFCGSGIQIGWPEQGLQRELPDAVALLQVHAINPSGFAWLRRVTEDNVDLNRNFVDHSAPYPENPGYEALHEALCPEDWTDAVIAETREVFAAYAREHGAMGLQRAIAGGQYIHADGIFYGGSAMTWSHRTLDRICADFLGHARYVAVVDYHTGLGPYGHGERICAQSVESPGLERAQAWFSGDVTCPELGTSSSSEIHGGNQAGLEAALPHVALTAVALEYGTRNMEDVKLALRADNWLHLHGDLASPKGRAIKAQIRDAFYPDADDWREMVWERAVETQRCALAALADG